MKICIFTRDNDLRLSYLLKCFRDENIHIDLVICATQKKSQESLVRKVRKLILPPKQEVNVVDGLDVHTEIVVNHSSSETRELLVKNKIDLVFLSKAGIIRKNIINGPWKIINCHPGILPRYRGVGSCEWAAYERGPLGVTVHYVDPGIDTGPILHREYVKPQQHEQLSDFRKRLDRLGVFLMAQIANKKIDGLDIVPEIQSKQVGVLYTRRPNQKESNYVNRIFREQYMTGLEK
jgi:methionyl-tRNA formyltransferase